jgi:hypothetical protein
MKRPTLFIDEGMEHELHGVARRKGLPVSALVRDALGRYLAAENGRQKFALRFLGVGCSGRKAVAERHEDLLWRDLKPHDTLPVTTRRRRKAT